MNNSLTPVTTLQTTPFAQKAAEISKIRMKPKTKKELAREYAVHPQTMGDWCRRVGVEGRKKLSIPQLLIIYKTYGVPDNYDLGVVFD